jgi:predicted small integral membrane protein
MKALIVIILVVFAPFLVALTVNPGLEHIQNSSRVESVQVSHISRPDVAASADEALSASGEIVGTAYGSFGVVIQEAITTVLLVIGSIAVLKKNKNK